MKRFTLRMSTLLIVCTIAFSLSAQKITIGTDVDVDISTSHPYSIDKVGVAFEQEFFKEGSGYVKIYFKNFDLAENDFVEVYSPETGESLKYYGRGKVVRGGAAIISNFWTASIWSDKVIVKLHSSEPSTNYGFDIEKVAYGFSSEEIEERFQDSFKSICGVDDKEWAKCYEGTEMYEKAKAVSRLYIDGSGACTGWLLGSEGHMMTNNHCIDNQSSADNTEYEFMAEGATCETSCTGWLSCRGTIEAYSGTLIKTNSTYDYALVKLPGNLSNIYGYLSFRSTLPSVGERIYIPQHPGAKGKQFSVWDDQGNDYSKVNSIGTDVSYYADTEGGSSGSPVIAYSDNLVVALHHYGGCTNSGVKNTSIISNLGSSMPENGVGGGTIPGGDKLDIIVNGVTKTLPDFVPYSTQDNSGAITISGSTASMTGNGWKAASLNYTVTENTVLEFDFSSSDEGEISAIGLESNLTYNDAVRCFKVYGTQDWTGVNSDFDNYSSGTKHYTIPLGSYYTGSASYLALINDNDAGSGNSKFSNINIHEGSISNCKKSPLSLKITFDDYPYETSWTIQMGSTVVASSDSYSNEPDGSTITENIILGSGNYTFTIYDSYSDGVCCTYGNGSFTLEDNRGTEIFSGGSFGSSDSKDFCIGESGQIEKIEPKMEISKVEELLIYPNPVKSVLYIKGIDKDETYNIFNANGKMVLHDRTNELNVSELESGLYILLTEKNKKMKFVKE